MDPRERWQALHTNLRAARAAVDRGDRAAALAAVDAALDMDPNFLAAQSLRDGAFEYANDLEPAARRLCPLINPALRALRDVGAKYPMVTGSGPTVFGISDDAEALAYLQRTYPRAVAA